MIRHRNRRISALLTLSLMLLLGTGCPPTEGAEGGAGQGAGGSGAPTQDNAGSGAVGMGGGTFGGDQDLVGNWNVTLSADDDTASCTAAIGADLSFEVLCEEGDDDDDEGDASNCEQTVDRIRVKGAIAAPSGNLRIDEVSRFSGSDCAAKGLVVDKDLVDTEADGTLTRTKAGVGSLGGEWTAKFFEWGCPGDEDCEASERVRDKQSMLTCRYAMSASGGITVDCTDDDEDDECPEAFSVKGSLGGGKLDISVTEKGCRGEAGDVITVNAKRR